MTRLFGHSLQSFNLLVAAATLTAALGPDVHATTTAKLGMAEMVNTADAIVIGRAAEAQSLRIGRNVYTRYRVVVQEDLLGTHRSEVSVVVPGGLDRGGPHPLLFSVEDAPVLQRGALAALLLQQGNVTGAQDYRIVGFNTGYIRLDSGADADSGATTEARLQRLRGWMQPLIAARQASTLRSPTQAVPTKPVQRPSTRQPDPTHPNLAR